jgi:hypothetical protein
MMVDRLVRHDSAGVLALCALFTLIGTIMGFILLGGKIYDTRMPGGMTNALGLTPLRSTQKDLRFYEESLVVMRNSRVLIHSPGREPEDNLAGWPGLAYTESTPRIYASRTDTDEQSQLAAYINTLQEYLGNNDVEDTALGPRSSSGIINVSTTLSFVRNLRIEDWRISLADGMESKNLVPYIVAVVNERVNFDTLTESLFCVSQLVVGSGWSTIQARIHVALGYLGDVYTMIILFVARAVLAGLFSALFYVHLKVLTGKLQVEEKKRLDEARNALKFIQVQGLWTIYYQDGTMENPELEKSWVKSQEKDLKKLLKTKGRAVTKLVRIKHRQGRTLEIFSELHGWTPARGTMNLTGDSIMAFLDREKSSKVNGRIFPDATGFYGAIIAWDNGQTWVLETKNIKAKTTPAPAARLDQVQNLTKPEPGQRVLGPSVSQSASRQGQGKGAMEQEDDEEFDSSSEDEASVHEWKVSSHAAPTHTPEVIEYMNKETLFTWKIIDISHITPMSKHDELWLPNFQYWVFKTRFDGWSRRFKTYILESLNTKGDEEETVVEIKTLKDLNFETCSANELRAFFEDKTYQKDVQTMLRVYLEIGMSQLMRKKDRLSVCVYVCTYMLRPNLYVCIYV